MGWQGEWSKTAELFGRPTRNTLGFELRQDRIDPVGLYSTLRRDRLSTTREDDVTEGSAGIYGQNDTQWNDWFRSVLGLRYDRYRFKVDSEHSRELGRRDGRHLRRPRRRSSSARGRRPNTSSTRATASTATTRAA